MWLVEATLVGSLGSVVSMSKAPNTTVLVQFPVLSTVQIWKYQLPSPRALLVVPVAPSSRSLLWEQVGVLN